MSEPEWQDVQSSVSGLRTAVVVLIVVIVLFCILQIISLIYKAILMRRNFRKRKMERMRRSIAAERKKKRHTSRSSDRHRNIPKHKRTNDAEPSKTATIRLSLSHEDDQSMESRRTNEKIEKKNKKSQSLSEDSLKVEAALPLDMRDSEGVTSKPTIGKGDAELSNTTKDAPPSGANVDPSVAAATVDKSEDKRMPKPLEPPHEVNGTNNQAANLVTQHPALKLSDDQKLLPVEKQKEASVKGTENKNTGISSESSSSKKGAAATVIPETLSTNASTASENSKATAKPAPPLSDSSKSSESLSGGKPAPASGKGLKLTIGI